MAQILSHTQINMILPCNNDDAYEYHYVIFF
jgi:hypothetical protein